jgi:FtsZ-binding cell division protein ZapB
MAMEEFMFPDEKVKPEAEAKEEELDVSVEGAAEEEEVVVVDDTPPEDRGRKPLGKTADEIAPDSEVEEYSATVKKRIAELKHTYHDERRAKEAATREKDEALRLAQSVYEENQRLKQQSAGWQKAGQEAFKAAAGKDLEAAQRALKAAYESGDSDAVVTASEALADAKLKIAQAAAFRPAAPLQPEQNAVQTPQQTQAPRPDERSVRWQQANKWFGTDEEMTAYALGLHQKLVRTGVDPAQDPDTYYERLNTRIREKFPEAFEDAPAEEDSPPKKTAKATPAATVVAPASRNSAPKKVVLTRSQEAIARSLGVPIKEYARQLRMINESEPKRNG